MITVQKQTYHSLAQDRVSQNNFSKFAKCFEDIDIIARRKDDSNLKQQIHSSLRRYVHAGCDLNLREANGHNLLFHAVLKCQKEYVEQLCELKLDINSKDFKGNFPLLSAIDKTHSAIALCLIDNGADLNMQDFNGITPLMKSIIVGNLTLFDKLMDTKRCKLDLPEAKGFTALHTVVKIWGSDPNGPHFLQRLIEQKASVSIRNDDAKLPLHTCIDTNNFFAMFAILDAITKEEIKSHSPETYTTYPEYCIRANKIDIAIILVKIYGSGPKAKLDLNATDIYGKNVLWTAVKTNNLALVTELVENGCNFRVGGTDSLGFSVINVTFYGRTTDINITKYFIDKYLALGDMSFISNGLNNRFSIGIINFCNENLDTRMKIRQVYKRDLMSITTNPDHLLKKFYNSGGYNLIDLFIEYLC
ncbi:MAG: hypothetical protein Harvfovirus20_15 [Harvfovirus sp.]|uniref:Uncharacterized protein n=1 Tax=Harvfovirus sp. TaxID=2487768 RepID=A0A3G5A1T5_9VIRU|nr:MAG: hypothetical protein Harvfovirus20_15 [Harvfovirus sp.]